MKKHLLTLVVLWISSQVSYADTLTVKQDGTGDYTTIQQAILHAGTGDTVLVYPGTYYENVDFLYNSVTLASLYLTTQDETMISQTIIDGNQAGSCVIMQNGIEDATLTGFTLQNGIGTRIGTSNSGGGIFIKECDSIFINHCIIQNNIVNGSGGGIFCWKSNLSLSGNIIRNNHSWWIGGGINAASYSIYFDTVDLNSIYMNYAYVGLDIARGYNCTVNLIKLDTATVVNPDYYFVSSIDGRVFYIDDITVEANAGKIVQVDTDLYVNPEGSNDNDGLKPETPLQTIAYALQKIKKNNSKVNTIHLANGVYSASQTGEMLPLCFKDSIAIIGETRAGTIIDSEYKSSFGTLPPGEDLLILKKLTYKKGNGYTNGFHFGGIWASYKKKVIFDSLIIDSCRAWTYILSLGVNDSTLVTNSLISHNRSANIITTGNSYDINTSNVYFTSNKFIGNYPDTVEKIEGPLSIHGLEILHNGNGRVNANVVNCEFSENISWDDNTLVPAGFGLGFSAHTNGNLVNSTFCYNTGTYYNDGVAFSVGFSSIGRVYNCIFYGNEPYQINTGNLKPQDLDSLMIYYSLIEDGLNGIKFPAPYYYFYYDTTNIDNDPLFYGGAEFPYNLSDMSPCIDAGTLDLPEGVKLPDVDLAGNPRIFNSKLDMGAYEWNPTVDIDEFSTPNTKLQTQNLNVYPNPFSQTSYIMAKWETTAQIDIEVYNNAGLLVRTLQSGHQLPGNYKIPWDGTDNFGNNLPSGIYYIALRIDNRKIKSVKIIKQ
ncbi:MAG: hypothetical protein DRJ09_04415 [Bacteroidetes bacterium]|nr:MAG: hypothetical protein DRJ09_04415 [Bacteroidota bacterium]